MEAVTTAVLGWITAFLGWMAREAGRPALRLVLALLLGLGLSLVTTLSLHTVVTWITGWLLPKLWTLVKLWGWFMAVGFFTLFFMALILKYGGNDEEALDTAVDAIYAGGSALYASGGSLLGAACRQWPGLPDKLCHTYRVVAAVVGAHGIPDEDWPEVVRLYRAQRDKD